MTPEEKTLIEELHGFAGGGASAPSSRMRDAAATLEKAIKERDSAMKSYGAYLRLHYDLGRALGTLARIRAARNNHPVCGKHPEDDIVVCGWKNTVIDIDNALKEEG